MAEETKSLIDRVREQAGSMSAVLHWNVSMFFEAADTIESLQLEKKEYLQLAAHNLNGDCICPAGYPGAHPKASHYPGCPIVLNQKIESLQADKAELVKYADQICQAKLEGNSHYLSQLIENLEPLITKHGSTSTSGGEELKSCQAGKDGDCIHAQCPQLRDNEPASTGRHCPIDTQTYGDD